MLIYNPAFDIYHCIYRILTALTILPNKEYRIEMVRIIDFYILFPHLFSELSLPRHYRKLKDSLRHLKTNYNDVPNHKRLYIDLYGLQMHGLHYLASIELLNEVKLKENLIVRTSLRLPDALSGVITQGLSEAPFVTEMILALGEMPLNGLAGLKAKSGLMEYRYDII